MQKLSVLGFPLHFFRISLCTIAGERREFFEIETLFAAIGHGTKAVILQTQGTCASSHTNFAEAIATLCNPAFWTSTPTDRCSDSAQEASNTAGYAETAARIRKAIFDALCSGTFLFVPARKGAVEYTVAAIDAALA